MRVHRFISPGGPRRIVARIAAGLLVSTGLIPVVASASQAAATPTSQGYALSASVTAPLTSPITIAQQATSAYPGGPATANNFSAPGVASTGAVATTANGSDPQGMSDASTSVAGLNVLSSLVSASTVTSSCTADGGGVTATTNLLGLDINGTPAGTQTPAPNTPTSAGGVSIIQNEQVIDLSGGRNRISVNALHIQLNVLGVVTGDIVVGHSDCAADAAAPTVSSISPTSGVTAGGTTVVISGTGFTAATGVTFGGHNATSYTVDSGTQITAVTPPGSAGAVDVEVTNATGTSSHSASDQFTYIAPPAVTALAPTSGPLASGTSVTITGTALTGATAVSFGGTPAVSFTVNSATSITAVAPAGTAGTVSVSVATPGGTSANVTADDYTYITAPTITSMDTHAGPLGGGSTVVITGTDLGTVTALSFGGSPATSFTINSPTQITAVAPAGTGTIDVQVTNPGGTSPNTTADDFAYVNVPGITAISPSNGPVTSGTSMTITGTGFTGATSVKFGTTLAVSFTVNSDTSITAIAPAGSTGTVSVSVATPGGTSANVTADDYTYITAPTITSMDTHAGPLGGGSTVVITGTDLGTVTALSFGGSPATSFTINSPTQITAVAPAGTGTIDVQVTNPGGTSPNTTADDFAYVNVPGITAISPSNGPVTSGTSVTITGTGFTGATSVKFGTTLAVSFTVNSDTSITAIAPAGSAGTVSVSVATPGGTSANVTADDYTYITAPTITSMDTHAGPLGGGTSVVITGTGLGTVTAVSFGGSPATSFTIDSPTQITAVAPSGSGTVDVRVTNPGGTSPNTTADDFDYVSPPSIGGISPAAGPVGGTTSVTITGNGFTGATAVSFGSTSATSFTVNSATSITAIAPAGSAGTVSVSVTNPGGTSANVAADDYDYVTAPSVTAIGTAAGPVGGGTSVVITGTGFGSATAVSFGGSPATSFTIDSPTQITAVAPGGSGTVDVRVTNPGGTSPNTGTDDFTYLAAPSISGISPTAGPLGGGTQVTITGTGLDTATAVTFGGTSVAFTVVSPTQITATSPSGTAGSTDIQVTGTGGASANTGADNFTYAVAPAIGTVSPGSGSTGGGTTVVINGTGLTGASAVNFGSTPASSFVVDSPTQITAIAPAGGSGTVAVTVTTPGGVVSGSYTYVSSPVVVPAPAVSGVTPSRGLLDGGTRVTIRGSGFTSASTVNFGTVPGTNLTVVSDTEITVTTPAHARGDVDVIVVGPGGPSATSDGARFGYLSGADRPVISSITPKLGPVVGGTRITITGTGFDDSTTVVFADTPGTDVSLPNTAGASHGGSAQTADVSDSLTVTTPAHAKGPQTVYVTNAAGTTTFSKGFTFVPTLQPVTLSITVPVGGTKIVSPSGDSYSNLTVNRCTRGNGKTSLSSGGTSCIYLAPEQAGTDSFTMDVEDALGQTTVQTVNVTITPVSDSTGGGGTGGNGTGGSGDDGGDGGSGGSGGGGGTGDNGGSGGSGTAGDTGGTSDGGSASGGGSTSNGGGRNGSSEKGRGSGTKASSAKSGARPAADPATGSDSTSKLGTSGDELNSASGSSKWPFLLALLAGLFLAWLIFFLLGRRRRRWKEEQEWKEAALAFEQKKRAAMQRQARVLAGAGTTASSRR